MRALLVGFCCCLWVGVAAADGYAALNAGLAASLRDDSDVAIQQLSLALGAPDLPARFVPLAHYDRALAFVDEEQYQRAVGDCSAALAFRPDWYDALLLRARAYAGEGKFDEALSDVSAAIAIRPELPWGLTLKAYIHLRQKDYKSAIDDDTRATALDPLSTAPLYARALAYDFAQQYDLALNDRLAGASLLANPHGADLWTGVAQWLAGHADEAVSDFQSAAAQDPESRYPPLWKVIALSGSDASIADLSRSAAQFDLNQWPGPIVMLYLGKAAPKDVVSAVAAAAPGERSDRKCEADFYLAEWQIIHRAVGGVKEMLTNATDECRYTTLELPAAKRELHRLEQSNGSL